MSPFVIVPQHFGCLLFDRRSSRYYPFDEEATRLLRDLTRHPDAIAVEMQPDPLGALDLLTRLDPLALLRPDGILAADVLDVTPPTDHLLGPLAVHVEVIGTCNLRCAHCFAAPLPRGRDALSLAELADLFRQLAALGSFRLGLTGGEPLLRRDFLEVLDSATDVGLHPCITTNGFFLTDELAQQLSRRPLVWLNVSLDGARRETNDAVRGAGTFDRVMARLRTLRDHARFTLAFTLTSANAHEVDDCVALAEEVGAHTAVFRPLYPTGAALQRLDLMPTFDVYRAALDRLAALATPRVGGCSQGPLPGRSIEPFGPDARAHSAGKVHRGEGCGAANTVCSVSVEGRVSPCSFLGQAFESASIRDRPFREIWNEGSTFARLREARDEAFGGGCRARSLALAGSVHARDPWEVAWRAGASGSPDETIEVNVGK